MAFRRNWLGIVVGAALSWPIAPALSAPRAEDAQKIGDCLRLAQENGNFGGQCIGIVADPCMAEAGSDPEAFEATKRCAARELEVWKVELNKATALVGQGGFPALSAMVRNTTRPWSDYVNSVCPFFEQLRAELSAGGANYCRMQETARRALMLRRLGVAVTDSPH
jgi:hypothetical protein